MKELLLPRTQVNPELLNEELEKAIPSKIANGCGTTPTHIIIFLLDEATSGDMLTAMQTVFAHDASKLTVDQQNEKEKLDELRLARQQAGEPLALDGFPADTLPSEAIQILAKKVAWLERELHMLIERQLQ